MRIVRCRHFGDEREGLSAPPFPGPLGEEIYQHVSREAWDAWLRRQTILINEYRLVVTKPEARRLLQEEMRAFLFHEPLPEGRGNPGEGEHPAGSDTRTR